MSDVTGATYRWLKETISTLPRDEGTFLTEAEVARFVRRAEHLALTGEFPAPSPEWPAIPWPAF